MSQILSADNIEFAPMLARDNEVVMVLHVMQETVYILSPMVALHLAKQLEVHARNAIEAQKKALASFEGRAK